MSPNKPPQSTKNPENYTRAIVSLSRRYASASVFPGNNYVDLAEWMLQDRAVVTRTSSPAKEATHMHQPDAEYDTVIVYRSTDKKWHVECYDSIAWQALSGASQIPTGDGGQIVFIRGFIPPQWVAAIGSEYNVDPEFFRRHMDFLSVSAERHAYSSPSLASSSSNIFRLCVTTVLHGDDFGDKNIHRQRSKESEEMTKYRITQLISSKIRCGESVVREYATLCSSFSIVEQWISFCVAKTTNGWAVIVWMDHGRPLEHSPAGPWTRNIQNKATAIPTVQHHPKMAFRTTTSRLEAETKATAHTMQSTAVLPLQYDSIVALVDLARKAATDPLSMCIPLFAHAAFAEVQFLNLMQSKIESHIDTMADGVTAEMLKSLQYFATILSRHTHQLKHGRFALVRLADWSAQCANAAKPASPEPRGTGGALPMMDAATGGPTCFPVGHQSGSFTAKGLLEDYDDLGARCAHLSKLCSRGITLAMNRAVIDESRRAVEQSERVKKLTILATLFIPLSFCSSLFGMNIDILGQGSVRFWWFLVVCAPITLLAYLFYLWDSQAVMKWSLRMYQSSVPWSDSSQLA